MMMRLSPDEGMKEFITVLLEKYGQAQAMFPPLARELQAHIRSGAPLGREFDAVFG